MLALVAAALHIQDLADRSVSRSHELTKKQREFSRHLSALKAALYATETGLYQYAVLMDEDRRKALQRASAEALQHARHLVGSELTHGDPALTRLVQSVAEDAARLQKEAEHLFRTVDDTRVRFPASVVVTESLYPTNLQFSTAVADAIADVQNSTEGPRRTQLIELLYEMRYYWVQQTSAVRMYIANRSGVFGSYRESMKQQLTNRRYYAHQVDDYLDRLEKVNEAHPLGLRFGSALEEMRQAAADYDRYLQSVVKIYQSGHWRQDIPLFRQRIQPLFTQLRGKIGAIEEQLSTLSSNTLMASLDTTGDISYLLWLVTAFAAVFLAALFLSYEYIIRRPIQQVTGALQALGKGVAYTPLVKTHARETERMMAAFREMQNEVNSRETRLRAILDNASDGIITINAGGIIETFNTAAEQLFGYAASEAIGQNVSMLMPSPIRHEHDRFIQRYLETGERRVVGTEVNVNAQHRDGTVFPISIKLSELSLDGAQYFTAIVSDISERKAMMDHLRRLAEHDALTELYNRQYFLQELERVVERAKRQNGLNCALLYIDLDNFKFVNDTLGHLAGDRVLVEVAALIRERSRKGDVIARLGGDEFAILLFDVEADQVLNIAEDYRRRMVDYAFRHETRLIDVGCSIGAAMLADDIQSKEDIMSRADLSCHMAKRAGRNCVHLYQADDRQSVDDMSADMGWARDIKHAVEHNRFDFALQPIVNLASGELEAYEVLIRMLDADGGIIMPSGFLPSAERFGLIIDIDRWVIAHAIDLLALRGNEKERFAINLSAMSIGDSDLVNHISGLLAHHEVDPTRITFEITETVAISDLNAAMGLLEQVRALGCKTALDDFGTGYSSFAYLKDLPVDYLKVDGSFVRGIEEDPLHLAMVKSMNEIAHAMGKETVAEFVCSARIMELLKGIGVDHVQGYHVGRPELVGYPEMLQRDESLTLSAEH